MSRTSPLLPSLFCGALAALVPAQRTVVVDAANGPGTDHTTLTAALTAVQDGDRIVVRAGTYEGASIRTYASFAMFAEGAVLVVPQTITPTPSAALRIQLDGSPDQRLSIRGFTFNSNYTGQSALTVRSPRWTWPAPSVHIEDCIITSQSPNPSWVGLSVVALSAIIERCTMETTQFYDSVATVLDSQIRGHDAQLNGPFIQSAQPAVDVLNSEVWFCNCQLKAGDQFAYNRPSPSCLGFSDATTKPASEVFLCGTTTLIGDQSPSPNFPTPALIRTYSTVGLTAHVHAEPSVTLVPSPGGGLTANLVVLDTRAIPNLGATAAPRGGVFTSTVHGAVGDSGAVLLGFVNSPSRVLGRAIFLDLNTALTIGIGTIDPTGQVAFGLAVPNDPTLRGAALETTGVTISTLGAISITNPAGAIVD